METAYSILQNHLSPPYCLSLLIVFIATLLIWHLIAKKPLTQSILISLFVTYIFFILLITLIARTPADTRHIKLVPFWSWYEVIVNGDRGLAVEILLNILLFVPVGVLMRCFGVGIKRVFTLRRVALFSLFLSLTIELTQYFTCLGLCEIWDDVVSNTCGSVIGWYIGDWVKRAWEACHNPSAKKQ